MGVSIDRDKNPIVAIQLGVIIGIEVKIFPKIDYPWNWPISAEPTLSLSTGGTVGGEGIAVGAGIELNGNIQTGQIDADGFVDLGIASVSGHHTSGPATHDRTMEFRFYIDSKPFYRDDNEYPNPMRPVQAAIFLGQTIRAADGTFVSVMQTIMTPSGAQQVWVGSTGIAQQSGNSDRDPGPPTPGGNPRPGDQHPPTAVKASTGPVSGESAANNGHGSSNQNHLSQVVEAAKRGVKIGGLPILLDLDGDGIEITELSKSTQFIDAGGVGLKHRTAWAGAGDGVLFIDADNDGWVSQKREYVFTEWDPTAQTDMQALRARFDSNGDGKLTAADTDFAKFKGVVTGANSSTSVQTLAALGITEIKLTEDAMQITSAVQGQSTFVMNGVTRTAASTLLMAEALGHRVVEELYALP